ncbi:MAG: hypothetical protein SVK54_02085, partial [candidate division WOR-3 bacterium]|nr:hypothetical protein [candidate division WOR-3 bacterium]
MKNQKSPSRKQRMNKLKKEIIELYDIEDGDLSARHIMYTHRALMGRAERLFGSWSKAVEYAGFNYDSIRKHETWTKEKIIEKIHAIYRNRGKLNTKSMIYNHNEVYQAGVRHFGSWADTIRAAGFVYSDIIEPPYMKTPYDERRHWTDELIAEEILDLYSSGEDINSYHMQRCHTQLLYAGTEHFGSWKNAVGYAGIDYSDIKKYADNWTPESILDKIREMKKSGLRMNYENAERNNASVVIKARTFFDSWDNALKEAGLDPSKERKKQKWSREKIIKMISERMNKGKSMKMKDLQKDNYPLYRVAI